MAKKKKAEQLEVPGTAKTIPELEKLAEEYREIRDDRMDLQKDEAEAKGALMAMCRKLEKEGKLTIEPRLTADEVIPVYRYVGEDGETELEVAYGHEEAVKVRKSRGKKNAA